MPCHCERCSAKPLPTWTEAHRRACEARAVAAMPTLLERRAYLEGVRSRRGHAAAQQLRADLGEIWGKKKKGRVSPPPMSAPEQVPLGLAGAGERRP